MHVPAGPLLIEVIFLPLMAAVDGVLLECVNTGTQMQTAGDSAPSALRPSSHVLFAFCLLYYFFPSTLPLAFVALSL